MTQPMNVTQTRSRRCDCCAEPWKKCQCWCSNCGLDYKDCRSKCYDPKCYICGKEHEFVITFMGRKHLLVCERCNNIVRLLISKGVDEYEDLAAL